MRSYFRLPSIYVRVTVLLIVTTCGFYQQARLQSNPIDSLVQVTQEASNDSIANAAYRSIMLHYILRTKSDSALYWGDQLIAFGEERDYPQSATTANYYKAYYNYRIGNYPEVIRLSKKVAQLSQEQQNISVTIDAYSKIADAHNLQGRYDSSQYYITQAEILAYSLGDEEQLSLVLNSKGNLLQAADQYDRAAESFLKVDSIQRRSDKPNHYRHGLARHNIALIYFQQLEKIEDAKKYALLAQQSYQASGGRATQSLYSLNILLSRIYISSENLIKADSLIDASISYYIQQAHNKKLAEAYIVKSNVNIEKGDLSAAESASLSALKIYTDINQPLEIGTTHSQLGRLYRERGNYNKSVYHLEQSLVGNLNQEAQLKSLQSLATTLQAKGDYKRAYDVLVTYSNLKDSLSILELDDRFAGYEVKYQTLDKERQIAQLEIDKIKSQAINNRNRLLAILLLGGLGGLALFLYQGNRLKKKRNNTLKEVDALKSKFFSNISHELRTPLALIKGPTDQLLKSSDLNDAVKQQLSIVRRNTKRLTRLVNDLLELSRIEAGSRSIKVQPVAAQEHLSMIFSNFESAAISNQQEYIYHVEEMPEEVYYEPQVIETIIYNLISNALKYSPQGALIDAQATHEQGNLSVHVHNDGLPIAPSELEKIFDRFYRSATADTGIEGMGVGLALVKELVKAHKGQIEVSSSKEEGTTFVVVIPVLSSAYSAQEQIYAPHIVVDPVTSADVIAPSLLDESEDAPLMLIVEDNPDMRSFLSSAFNNEYRVRVANNGKEGLNIAKQITPDVIITDMMMPEMDGAEMCKAIKEDVAISHIPVIVLTAKAEEQTKLSTLQIGVDDYMAKPFSIDEISIKVRNLLNIRKELQQRYSNAEYSEKTELAINPIDQQFWNQIEVVLSDQLTNDSYSIESFATDMSMSRMQLHRKLKALTGVSASTFLRNERLKKAKELMSTQKLRVSEVAYECGFSSPFYFSKCFKDQYGLSPKEYQEGLN